MTRYLTVTCTRAKCNTEGRVNLHGTEARDLPAGWLLVGFAYDGNPMEFCSLACVELWAEAMQKAHARRERRETPAGALL